MYHRPIHLNTKTSNVDVPILNTVDHFEDRNDENNEKKYLSMTPTNMRKPPPQPSSKKHSFVTASKVGGDELPKSGHHKVNSFKMEPKLE
jgi:hypothetical protein